MDSPTKNQNFCKAGVVIIGGGISGICTAIELITKYHIRDLVIVEKSSGFGGTWRDNKFPGCCCDVWSNLYCYSFDQKCDWARSYPGQEEILDYLLKVAHKNELFLYARFNSTVESARWDDVMKTWLVDVKVAGGKDAEFVNAYTIRSQFLVSCVGQLNAPKFPDIAGLSSFEGKLMHSARWDWTYFLDGKRVAVIGTGATAAQIVPEVAKVAGHVSILQRSPAWVLPRHDAPVPRWRQLLYEYCPLVQKQARAISMNIREQFFTAVVQASSDESQRMRDINQAHMKAQLPNRPDLWKLLTPDYPPGCKRSVLSDDYYLALTRPNVKLESRRIQEITPKGILFDGTDVDTEFDVIICATGFQTQEFMHNINITGQNNRSLQKIWNGVPHAYKGVTVEDVPNFGMLYGPNSNLSHNSLILVIEAQARYLSCLISETLKASTAGRSLVLTPKSQRVVKYNTQMQKVLRETSFADPRCSSWWKSSEGVIINNWSGTATSYQELLAEVDWDDFEETANGPRPIANKHGITYLGRVVEEARINVLGLLVSVGGVLAVVVALARGSYPRVVSFLHLS